ncbi:type IV pilus modification protein PilV [Acinetobacter populi]|uniref:Type IV pilus modification protein PilV n=1 Tax=Acinetobacter populi TaxID=1582270 RepID=A0A1Z9YWE6_9GAMM|nr:type IV pilus modification protein PilV [Acinetobacter populi]OUY06552.1 type IV pilus modification protein PilV [Acinetobacter populi]
MSYKKKQLGVGLVEVLVALIILAIGVLGYTALQLRAVDATSEALTKSQATLILRGLTESMRANALGQSSYPTAVASYVGFNKNTTAKKNCFSAACTPAEMANYDAFSAASAGFNEGIHLMMAKCPEVSTIINRQCLFAAWGETELKANDYSQCMDSNGVYATASQCLMMEAY